MEKSQYHLKIKHGDVGEYVILPGDPARCAYIAENFDNPSLVASNREFTTFSGFLEGIKVSVTSTGIGGPSAAIALEELIRAGARVFIRAGTCGGINEKVCPGDLVIATAAVRQEGTSGEYAPRSYPAAADFEVTCRLAASAESQGFKSHIGVVQSKDSFYGQHFPESMPVYEKLIYSWRAIKKLGVLASEMEAAALFTVAASRGVKCGAVLGCVWNRESSGGGDSFALESIAESAAKDAVKCAVEAIRLLIKDSFKSSAK
ncbi:MAG: uridine phosphorylase [Eubacteriales bacterium]